MPWPRNLIILVASVLVLTIGQEVWFGFAPEFLRALGASVVVVGLYSSLQDFFKALYYYPGGWLNDRFGMRIALVIANLAAAAGYLIYLVSPNFSFVFLGLPLIMAWPAFVVPATLKILGDWLPFKDRAAGFALEAAVTSLPRLAAPVAGGLLIGAIGSVVLGVRVGVGLTVLAAGLALVLQGLGYRPAPGVPTPFSPLGIWREMNGELKKLLFSEVLVGYAEAIPRALIVLYAIDRMGMPYWSFGLMLATEAAVALFVTVPARQMLARGGQRRLLLVSFLCTALFPASLFVAPGWVWLFGSFVLAGLRSTGEAVRATVLSSLAHPERMAAHVGLYESVLSLAILPAGFAGGLLWSLVGPWSAFALSLAAGLIGCVVYWFGGPGEIRAPQDL
jgi:MFS family permease